MRGRAVLLALAVVLAGCGGAFTAERPVGEQAATPTAPADPATPAPTADETAGQNGTDTATEAGGTATAETGGTPTPRDAGKVSVSGRALSFEEEVVYRDVVALHGRSYASAPEVQLTVRKRPTDARSGQVISSTPFLRLWGFDADAVNGTGIAGLAIQQRVFLYTAIVPDRTQRKIVLAHEYTHVLQWDTNAFSRIQKGVTVGEGNHERLYVAVVEGTASYAEAEYAATYLDVSRERRTWSEYSANRSRIGAYLIAPYYFGERYVRTRVDAVENLSIVYDDPPRTTEQLVHGHPPDEEPPRELAVTDRPGETDWTAWNPRTKGELTVRLVLEGELDGERAARAAAGWGADRLVQFDHPGHATSYAWVLRWDSPAEADEFHAAMTDYLDARGERTDGRWTDGTEQFDLQRVGDETVVVLAGPEAFVANAFADGESDAVTVSIDG